MFCTPALFTLCNELQAWGIHPTFEVGQMVARGFADVGSEEFLVLPGEKLLSLTAGTIKPLPEDHREFFYWIPSEDECAKQIYLLGIAKISISRELARKWVVTCEAEGETVETSDKFLQMAMVQMLLETKKRLVKKG
jgi:hypothetical protein